MRFDNKEFNDRRCSVCGELTGYTIDHDECSKLKQELNKDVIRHKAKKKLGKSGINYLGGLG